MQKFMIELKKIANKYNHINVATNLKILMLIHNVITI